METMKRAMVILLALVLSGSTLSCGGTNIFQETAKKDSDEAIYQDALTLTNSGQYTDALAKFAELGGSYLSEPKVQRALAGAYAGQCGQNLLNQTTSMGNSGNGAPLAMFMSMFTTTSVVPASCYQAQLTIERSFGATANLRSSSDNMFMAILGMSKIGTYLRKGADVDQDGTVDINDQADACGGVDTDLVPDGKAGPFDACNSACLSDSEVKQIGTGLGLIIDNFAAVSAQLGGQQGSLNDLQAKCIQLAAANGGVNPCVITDPTSSTWDANTIKVFRSLIKSTSFGIQTCNLDPLVLCCP